MMRTLSWRFSTLLTVPVLLLATNCSSGSSSLTAPSDSDQSLVIVLYGDSLLTYPEPDRGAIDAYIDMLEEDVGARVNVQASTRSAASSGFVEQHPMSRAV